MKFTEDQMVHFKSSMLIDSDGNQRMISSYQHLLDLIISEII